MATIWKTDQILINGMNVKATAPEIISASRSTDIPAFYSDWFFHRLREGYSAWTNPFNGVKSYVSYKNTRFIVFWSKNPQPLLNHLSYLKERNINCYIQYSLNDYEAEGLEKGVPPLQERVDTFKRLVDVLGKGGVIWRFDPLMLTDDICIDELISKIEGIGEQLKGYTEKLVYSYADISTYRKVQSNLKKNNIPYKEWTDSQMDEFAQKLSALNSKWNLHLATCGEQRTFLQYGIEANHCIDDELIIKRAYKDKVLMDFLNAKILPIPEPDLFGNCEIPENAIILPNRQYAIRGNNSDKGQRSYCGCMKSKDIGEYNTCVHLCDYCYANTSKQVAQMNYERHKENPFAETITGK